MDASGFLIVQMRPKFCGARSKSGDGFVTFVVLFAAESIKSIACDACELDDKSDDGDDGGDDDGDGSGEEQNVKRRKIGRVGKAYVRAVVDFRGTTFFFSVWFGGVGVVDDVRCARCARDPGDSSVEVEACDISERPSMLGCKARTTTFCVVRLRP